MPSRATGALGFMLSVVMCGCTFEVGALPAPGDGATPATGDAGPADGSPADAPAVEAGPGDAPHDGFLADTAVDAPAADAVVDAAGAEASDDAGDDAPAADGPTDAATGEDGPPCTVWSWDPSNVNLCGAGTPAAVDGLHLTARAWTYDTDTGELASAGLPTAVPTSALSAQTTGGAEVRIVSLLGLQVDAGATVTVTGSRPLIIVVHGDATVDGTIDASARLDTNSESIPGPGGNDPTECGSSTGAPGEDALDSSSGGGGGGGGGFGGDGGDGGDGDGGDGTGPWVAPPARPFGLVAEFPRPDKTQPVEQLQAGLNPGDLNMYLYVPEGLPPHAPVVVALHGCNQAGAVNPMTGGYLGANNHAEKYMRESGWATLADRMKFYVIFPEQNRRKTIHEDENGWNKYQIGSDTACFNWAGFYGRNQARGQGENQSIIQMIEWLRDQPQYSIDESRVYITGFSGGGAMAVLMAATWPDRFAGAASNSGLAYHCANNVQLTGDHDTKILDEVVACQGIDGNFQPINGCFDVACMNADHKYSPEQWGGYVRDFGSPGVTVTRYPRMIFWAGDKDEYVDFAQLEQQTKQWTNVHGIDQAADNGGSLLKAGNTKHVYQEYCAPGSAEPLVASVRLKGMKHGIAVDPGDGPDQGGFDAGMHGLTDFNFSYSWGIYSSYYTAMFWGLGVADSPAVTITSPTEGQPGLDGTVVIAADVSDAAGVASVAFAVDGTVVATATAAPYEASWDTTTATDGAHTIAVTATNTLGKTTTKSLTVSVRTAGCQAFTATNLEHVAAGRAEEYTQFTIKYARTVGAGDDLGMLGTTVWSPTTTVRETTPGYYEKGACP